MWFADFAVSVEDTDPESTLNFYRRALALRAELLAGEGVRFVDDRPRVIEVVRDEGWRSITTFGVSAELPAGDILLASAPIGGDRLLPPERDRVAPRPRVMDVRGDRRHRQSASRCNTGAVFTAAR